MSTKASLFDLFGDLVIYRNLDALDARLPRFADAYGDMGLSGPIPPRKLDVAYAQALAWLVERSRQLAHRPSLTELVYLGDTMLNDGGAFINLRKQMGVPGWCFIGAEKDEELAISEQNGIYQANRWAALAEFLSWVQSQGAVLDARTAVIVDIDKTLLAARGRNDGTLDRARVVAVEATVAGALGGRFDRDGFRRVYAVLNASRYHPFTGDNQDIIAYVCLMLSAGLGALEQLQDEIGSGWLTDFRDFMAQMDRQPAQLAARGLLDLHREIYGRVLAGDPTPFKSFRRREYVETVSRMGHLPDDAPLAQRLVEEICVTREVYEAALWLKERGCLLLASSDKPDEATEPTADLAALGYLPLHRTATHIIGQSLDELLPSV